MPEHELEPGSAETPRRQTLDTGGCHWLDAHCDKPCQHLRDRGSAPISLSEHWTRRLRIRSYRPHR